MKLSIFLFFAFVFAVQAKSFSQSNTLTLNLTKARLIDVLVEIEEQTNYYFYYNINLDDYRVDQLKVKDQDVKEVLDKMLPELGLDYEVVDRYIVIKRSGETAESFPSVLQQTKSVSGKVTDSTGAPLPGVSVVVKGTTTGVITDMEGKYAISKVSDKATLLFSFVGMKTKEITVDGKTTINVALAEDAIGIDEVVAVGYGTQKKANLTGSVATVGAGELTKIVSTSTAQALQGRMAGVQISQDNGKPGSGSTIKIRGVGSLKSSNSPLVVVDGFIGSLDDISAGDIESVSVLKDAASCAIYGARAANGVILVTTKRGRLGKMAIDFQADYGIQGLTKKPDLLNAQEYAQKQNEERIYGKQDPFWKGDLAPEKLGEGTDWYDYVFGNKTPIQNYYLGLSGGSESTKYAISLGYIDQQGIILGSNYNRTNLRANFDHHFNKRVRLGVNLDLKRNNSYDETGDTYSLSKSVMTVAPTVPVFFPDGTPGIFLQSRPGEKTQDGMLTPNLLRGSYESTDQGLNARTSIFLEIELLKGLSFKSVFNKAIAYSTSKYWVPTYAYYSPESQTSPVISNTTASLNDSWSSGDTWELQELMTYKRSINDHNFTLLAGFSAEESYSKGISGRKTIFPNNELQVLNAGATINSLSGKTDVNAITSTFGQINYDYKGKYLFQSNVRRDGSSVFAPGNQFGVFPSVSAAWRISEESFIKNIISISNLKLRAGYGSLGNAGIPQYAWTSTYLLTDTHPFGPNIQSLNSAYYITDMTNKDIKWETTTTFDLGMDLGLFDNRFSFVADYYNKKTTDLLLDATIPGSSGKLKGPVVNLGEVQNKGWEISASWDDNVADFKYGVSLNISHNENMVLDMGGIKPQILGGKIVKEGLPINSFWGYKTDGIFRTWEEVNSYPHFGGDFRPGEYKVLDLSGPEGKPDGKITADDKIFLGDRNPKYYYGATLNAEWKGFDVSVLVSGEANKKALYENIWGSGPVVGQTVKYWYDNRAILDASGNVISGTTPVMGTKFNDWNYNSDANVYDVSFFRVKNIQLGYSLPKTWINKINVRSVRIYFNAVNPILFTKYVGADPETTAEDNSIGSSGRGGFTYYPVCKSYSVGLSLKL